MEPLFADVAASAPWWVAGALGVLTVLSSAGALYFWFKSKRRQDTAEDDALTAKRRADKATADEAETTAQEAKETRRRRESSEEAWQVVDQYAAVIKGYEGKVDALERKFDDAIRECEDERNQCAEDRAELRGMMVTLVAWAESKGMKVPAQFKADSKSHRTLPDEGK